MTAGMANAERLRALRVAAVAKGLCYTCRCRPQKPGARYCVDCIARAHAQSRAKERARRAESRCVRCGKKTKGTAKCRRCADLQNESQGEARAARVARGECYRCGRKNPDDTIYCRRCLPVMSAANNATYEDRKARGVCVDCGGGASADQYDSLREAPSAREPGESRVLPAQEGEGGVTGQIALLGEIRDAQTAAVLDSRALAQETCGPEAPRIDVEHGVDGGRK